jgi:hypothetical protein
MSAREQIVAQIFEVVDLTVEDDLHRAIFIRHRLVTRRKVNDRQTAMREPDASVAAGRVIFKEAFVIRAAVHYRIRHCAQPLGQAREWPSGYVTGYTAHVPSPGNRVASVDAVADNISSFRCFDRGVARIAK